MSPQLDIMNATTFKVTADGRNIFFPWGRLGRGYEVESKEDYATLKRRINVCVIAGMALMFAGLNLSGWLATFVAFVVWTACYLGWMWHLLPALKSSDEKL